MTARPARGAARLAAILDSLPDALLLVDARAIVVNANTRALDLFETTAGPLVGQMISDVLVEFDLSKAIVRNRRRKERRAEKLGPVAMTGRRTDGGTFTCDVSTSFLSNSGEEDLLVVVIRAAGASFGDSEEAARQAHQTELILRAASEAIVGVDAQGKIILANPAAARMLRCKAGELAGQDLHELAHHSRADGTPYPREESPLVETLRTGRRAKSREELLWRRDGSVITVEMSTLPVTEGTTLAGAIITYTDRSDLLAARKRRDALIHVLRRELGRPLRRARNDLARIAAGEYGELPATAQGALDELGGSLDRLVRIIGESLDQDRNDAAKTPLALERTEAAKVIQLAIEAASGAADAAGVRITNDADSVEIDADPDRLAKALTTVLQTAVSSAPAGSAVTVVAKRRGEQLRIVVRGTGTGKPPRIPARPSYDDRDELEAAVTQARRTVEQHGGRMVLNSSAADGTTCSIELPLPTPPQIDAATIIQVRPGHSGPQFAIPDPYGHVRSAGIPPQPAGTRQVPAQPAARTAPVSPATPAAGVTSTTAPPASPATATPAPATPTPAPAPATPTPAPAPTTTGTVSATAAPASARTERLTTPVTTPATPPATAPTATPTATPAAPPAPTSPSGPSHAPLTGPDGVGSSGLGGWPAPLPDVADLPSVADLPAVEVKPSGSALDGADRAPSPGSLLALPRSVLVWPQSHEGTAAALARRSWHSIPVGTPHDLTGYLSREPSALLIDPLTGPVTRTALTVIRNSAVEVGLPLVVAAGLGEVSANALYGSDPAALLRALIPSGRKNGRPARVLLIESDATVATVLGANLERRGMQVIHSTSESEAVLRAAITTPDLVVTDIMLTRPTGPGIVDWLRLHDRLAQTPMVAYTTAALEPAGYERLRRGETVLFLQGRAETQAVEERLTILVERMSGQG